MTHKTGRIFPVARRATSDQDLPDLPPICMILDATEFGMQVLKEIHLRGATYSNYKSKHTYVDAGLMIQCCSGSGPPPFSLRAARIKVLVSVNADGVITFVSRGYPGGISDNKATLLSNAMSQAVAGQAILVDKVLSLPGVAPKLHP